MVFKMSMLFSLKYLRALIGIEEILVCFLIVSYVMYVNSLGL